LKQKPPPHNVEAEEALLGSLLLDPGDAVPRVAGWLGPGDFYIQKNAWVYEAILDLYRRKDAIDYVTIADVLEAERRLDGVGGAAYITQLINAVPSAVNVESYARLVRDDAVRRQMLKVATDIAKRAYAEEGDVELAIQSAAAELKATLRARPQAGFSVLSADVILGTVWPEPVWAVPNLLPCGLTILAGKPKIGKSWLALQFAQAVGAGGVVLGETVQKGPVLYLALEDSPMRLKQRMTTQNWPLGLPVDFMPLGRFLEEIGDLRDGGGERLAWHIEEHGCRLAVIDTLSRAVSGDQNDVEQMTRALVPLQEMAHHLNCSVLLIDHHNKTLGEADAIRDILGSTSKGAVADAVMGLYREPGKVGAKLAVTGRDIVERELAITADWVTGCWQFEGDATELELTERRQEILLALDDLGPSTLTSIAKAVEQPKSHTHSRLQDLVNAGQVRRYKQNGKILYAATLFRDGGDESQ
jgi:replicative DNA helicase